LGRHSVFLGTFVQECLVGTITEIRELDFRIFQANRTLVASPSTPQSEGNLLERFATKEWELGKITHYEIPQRNAFSRCTYTISYEDCNSNLFDLVVVQVGATASTLAFEKPRRFGIRRLDVDGLGV
jgi:hypothetical protein